MSLPVRSTIGNSRWYRPVLAGLTLLILGLGAWLITIELTAGPLDWGLDFRHYLDGARRFVETGSPYVPAEVAAPFQFSDETFLHPPSSLYLLVPFIWLPALLWWAIPLILTASIIWSWRPAPWTWPVLAIAAAWPRLHGAIIYGNSDMWVLAAVTAGLEYGWPALLVLIKPSVGLLVFAGVRHRSWWLGWIVVAFLSIPMLALWSDWVHVVINSPGDPLYSVSMLPVYLAPVVAWLGRTRKRTEAVA
jgi:hypothetical protein